MVWVVLAGVVVLALVVLGVLVHGVLGAFTRLHRELEAAQREVAPLMTEARATAARASQAGERTASTG